MTFLMAAAALIIIAAVLKWVMGTNLEEGILGKCLLLIIVVLVVVGLLSVFGILPFRAWGAAI